MMSAAPVAVMNSQLLEPFNTASRFLGEHLNDDSLNSGIGEAVKKPHLVPQLGCEVQRTVPKPAPVSPEIARIIFFARSLFL
jgi:hypothetical protein